MPETSENLIPDSSASSPSARAVARAIAVLFASIALLVAADSLRLIVTYQPVVLQRPVITLLDVLGTQRPRALGAIYLGLAARELSGGPVVELVSPLRIGSLAKQDVDEPGDENIDPYNPHFLRQLTADNFTRLNYNPTLTQDELESLLSANETAQYPTKIVLVGVTAGGRRERLFMFTDGEQSRTYLVPESLVPKGNLP